MSDNYGVVPGLEELKDRVLAIEQKLIRLGGNTNAPEPEAAQAILGKSLTEKFAGCPSCGSSMVFIRGRHPNEDRREVCPTCTQERLDMIKEMSDPNYGRAVQSRK